MKNRSLATLGILSIGATVILSASLMAGQQPAGQARPAASAAAPAATKAAAPAAKPAWVQKKTPDGQPDLQGYWTNATYTPLTRANGVTKEFFTEEEYIQRLKNSQRGEEEQTTPGTAGDVHYDFTQFALDTSQSPIAKNLRTSLVIDPPDGQLPPRVGAAAPAGGRGAAPAGGRGAAPGGAVAAAGAPRGGGGGASTQYDQIQNMPTGSRCIVAGGAGPPMMDAGYNAAYQIVQSPGYVTILTEMIHDVRTIPLDPKGSPRPLPPAQVTKWGGISRGYWDGNTLVVETTNFNGRNAGRFNLGPNSRVVEKFTRTAEDRIEYLATVTDETVWTKPITVSVPLTAEKGPIFEFACHETNYGPYNILSGARQAEKEAAAAKK